MNRIWNRARADETLLIEVRRDRAAASPRMTRAGMVRDHSVYNPTRVGRTGNWRGWWREGCGVDAAGRPCCPPGHAYHIERYARKAKARSKVLGRRRERYAAKREMLRGE